MNNQTDLSVVGLVKDVVDEGIRRSAVARFRERGIALPTFGELARPETISPETSALAYGADSNSVDPLNLFKVHWHNEPDLKSRRATPSYCVLPSELTGVEAPIALAFGEFFPMIGSHKVLPAYACLAARVVTGRFDPAEQRAVWPSTGNYARGGVAISRIMGCRGVAVLPERMSQERFEWLKNWVLDEDDIVSTYGCESNVKEVFDACKALAQDTQNVIFDQFREMPNHLAHYHATGRALGEVFEHLSAQQPGWNLAAFVASSGSAGTLGAGDRLKEDYGARIAVVEPVQCPTLLRNGYGDHNIQGIGDKHVPLIHNVMNSDVIIGVSDESTDDLGVLFSHAAGRRMLEKRGISSEVVDAFQHVGLSGIANVLGAIKLAKYFDLGPDDLVLTLATDGARMYVSERDQRLRERFRGTFDDVDAASALSQHVDGAEASDILELGAHERERVFNLGYYTWVEQQGITLETFDARRSQRFWSEARAYLSVWDDLIREFNAMTGVGGKT